MSWTSIAFWEPGNPYHDWSVRINNHHCIDSTLNIYMFSLTVNKTNWVMQSRPYLLLLKTSSYEEIWIHWGTWFVGFRWWSSSIYTAGSWLQWIKRRLCISNSWSSLHRFRWPEENSEWWMVWVEKSCW